MFLSTGKTAGREENMSGVQIKTIRTAREYTIEEFENALHL